MYKQRFLPFVFSILLLLGLASGYTDTSFSVTFQLSPEKVHVVEKTVFLLDNDAERNAFSTSLRLGKSTVSDWKKYSRNIDYHVLGPFVLVNSTRIVAKRDFSLSHNPAVVVVEYDAKPAFLTKKIKSSRVTEFELNSSLLSLNRLESKEIVLGNIDELVFEIPYGTQFGKLHPTPSEKTYNMISFKGPLTSKFEISFIAEKTLSEEVGTFFLETYSNAANLIPLLLAFALLLFIAFKLVFAS